MSKPGDESGDGSSIAQSSVSSTELMDIFEDMNLNDLIVETKDLIFTNDKKKGNLLNKINMNFPRNTIYGFLGASGCGKTTMVKLILGLLKPVSGSVQINGKSIRDPANKIPGNGIGYMPQDYSLYGELTIIETLNYMAGIHGLPKDYRESRIKFLINYLQLPKPDTLTLVLSGGEKRLTSLALALIHNPKFLILDEPTVGVDPMLRERIWQHLVYLSTNEKTSIFVTTLYIDDCQRADIIALMRCGSLLVESTPNILLRHFQTYNLEEVFLEVCRNEELPNRPNLPPNLAKLRKDKRAQGKPSTEDDKKDEKEESFRSSFCGRYLALVVKNAFKLRRHKLLVLALIISPLFATLLVCTTFGKKPFDLKVAVYNEEVEKNSANKYSLKFLNKIDHKIINLDYGYKSNDSAQNSVKNGRTFGALIIEKDFSKALLLRAATTKFDVSDEVIQQSTIQFYADTTDMMIFQAMFRTLFDAEFAFQKEMIESTPYMGGSNPRIMDPIVNFVNPPVYGSLDPKFIDFGAPGIMIFVVYIFSMGVSALDIIGERIEGTLDRIVVAGVGTLEIILALITVQFIILLIQTLSIVFLMFYVFEIENKGNFGLIIGIILLQGVQGMACGLFISAISNSELMALELCVGISSLFLIISGILWPREGMHYILRTVSLFTPQTLPILSLKNIMLKGWGLGHSIVRGGFMASIGFFIVFVILSTIVASFVKR